MMTEYYTNLMTLLMIVFRKVAMEAWIVALFRKRPEMRDELEAAHGASVKLQRRGERRDGSGRFETAGTDKFGQRKIPKDECFINVRGKPACVKSCKAALVKLRTSAIVITIYETRIFGALIGPKGATVMSLESESGADVSYIHILYFHYIVYD